ncbi:MAG: ABC transporter substrate-binding protein [Actinomycetales bacterium]|jgi:branched-chain amino acid transport system substrate-binding protein|uniref:ABC transporter substrate-binding protein n=1 Tax=Candidatus Phosphoribacter hodrii TaxID=2953743 RepID=A0A935IJZ1_9MICO|nr:ABC transporter substrate-binding protein [Candidatus Phosphoribacter hodrii]MBP8838744.1 ABC transporter substrate-binding protein [Dermatophilaceae bacterium]HNV14000.1 ABC transporter substrate-binding protein [Dermatophilaceae bacterium]HOA02844.1 ABC transporter substrate-binding protein [Dermatophilaceae bacterium]HOF37943.1 ABC transporter substrate-binding protein [Dermatophilaceae bacterium]
MDWTAVRLGRRGAVAVVAAAALGMSACSSSSGTSSTSAAAGGGLPATINVVSINPQTGPAAFAGLAANKGYDLAIKEINDSKFLGSTTLTLSKVDTKGDIKTAASSASTAIADKNVSAIFGSVSSQEAIAMSPLVQQAGLPTIYTQAGSDGVVVGDATYRATPLMRTYYSLVKKYVQEKGWKSVGIIHTAAAPTLVDIGTKALPAIATELGMTVTTTVAVQGTTQDFAAPISQVLASKPDGVAILLVGAQNPTAMKQLRQAGYTGDVLGNSGASAGNLKPAGADGAGMVWPVDFNFQQKAEASQKFVKAYQAANSGENPLNYAAEAYDAAWFLAKSIKAAGSADRAKIKTAMATVASEKFDGALGNGLTWKDRDIVVPGVMIRWDGTGDVLLYEGSAS